MQVIYTDKTRCRKTYSCVRVCPVDAIGVQEDGTVVSMERCIKCGNCVDACSQGAIKVMETVTRMEECLKAPEPTVLLLDANWPITFPGLSPMDFKSSLKQSGFAQVYSSFLAVKYVFAAYRKFLEQEKGPLIGSLCPITSTYVEKHTPGLTSRMMPIVTPAVATARYLRHETEGPVKIVLATSCLATKVVPETPGLESDLDAVVTLRELRAWLEDRDTCLQTKGPFNYKSELTAGAQFWLPEDFLSGLVPESMSPRSRILAVSGSANSLAFLDEVHEGTFQPDFAVVRYCSTDADSHGVNTPLTLYQRKDLIARVEEEAGSVKLPEAAPDGGPDLSRTFLDRSSDLPQPTEEIVQQILNEIGMPTPEDELDCGACGFPTCREKARAVSQGMARLEMCFPYLIRQLSTNNEELTRKYLVIQKQFDEATASMRMIGSSSQIQQIQEIIARVAPTPTTVLIRGESGTGKELVARAIHRASDRSDAPLIAINCTAIAAGVLDSELFGHVKGAFTSADTNKKGLFEEADGGTLFLDEIGDISLELQAKLLRAVDTGEIRRVGENVTKKVDVRFITATNRNLERAIEKREFREDLYYRLNTITIRTPPLRERRDDIPVLAEYLLSKAGARVNKQVHGISEKAMDIIKDYHWPGNVRELENVIERAVVLVPPLGVRVFIEPEHLPKGLELPRNGADGFEIEDGVDYRSMRNRSVGEVEKKLLAHYLTLAEGNVSKASKMAGIPRRTFYRLMDRLNLRAKDVVSPG